MYGYRFPTGIISHTVWLYHRFTLSFRDIEDLLAERGIIVTYETVRQWETQYLWRAVDQDGDVVDILVQSRRDKRAALRFFRKLLKAKALHRVKSWWISCEVTAPLGKK